LGIVREEIDGDVPQIACDTAYKKCIYLNPDVGDLGLPCDDKYDCLADQGAYAGSRFYYFLDMAYYIIVTVTTVGYGDIGPSNQYSRLLFIFIVVTVFSVLPYQLSEFQKAKNLTSLYSRQDYIPSRKEVKHILLLGDSSADAVKTFLKECFHSDHGPMETDVVIMRSDPPTDEMLEIINGPYQQQVFYLQGNPFNHNHLKRCMASRAFCTIIMTNQLCKNHQSEDYKNILHAFAVKNYVRQNNEEKREMRICLQISKPEHKDLFYSGLT
jgi:hypothetical protein